MLSNYHSHTTMCDGKNSPEEMIVAAIEKGFESFGFSGHGYTEMDKSYCVTDTDAYIEEINRIKSLYKDKIDVYVGLEEDVYGPCDRSKFDYIIGSMHYFLINGVYYPVDMDYQTMGKCVSLCDGNPLKLAELYFDNFCKYIIRRKPDIVGHFDLLTKFDEKYEPVFLKNQDYNKLAEDYLEKAITSGCVFEINTGAISRGYRNTPYPAENLLYLMKKQNVPIILSSDCHSTDSIDCCFTETEALLRDIGFENRYVIKDGKFVPINI